MSLILAEALSAHVYMLAGKIGERHGRRPEALREASAYVRGTLEGYGYQVRSLPYQAGGLLFENLEAVLPGADGSAAERLVVGAHYDTVEGTPGADDNASGIAGLLELARLARGRPCRKTLVFAAFSTEEPPYFGSRLMGSHFYAAEAKERGDRIAGMICLEMIGFYSREKGLQSYPPFLKYFFPDQADFIGLVGNLRSRKFLNSVRAGLERHMKLPLQHATLPALVPGVDFSDHRSFWKQGYPAVMLTDTAFYRNRHYHAPGDVPETLDYASLSALIQGLSETLAELCR